MEVAAAGLFITPMTGRLTNIGNMFGLAVALVCLAATVFWKPFCRLLKALWSKSWGKALLASAGAVLGLLVLYAIILTVLMTGAALNRPQSPDAVVVLGCKVSANGNPSLMLRDRIEAAYGYLSENQEVICVASGGQGEDEPVSEAQVIKDRLVEMGIEPSRILMEDKSSNTSENLGFSLEVLAENGVQAQSIAVVSDGFHQLRAALMAEEKGVTAYAVSADTRFWLVPTYWVREWFALSYLFVFGE